MTILHRPVMEAKALLAAIVESSDDAILSKTLDGAISSWNNAAERMFGYRASEVIGKSIRILIPEDRLPEEITILSKIESGERVANFETVRRRRDGTLLDLSVTVSPVRNDSGLIIGASKIARDITANRRVADHQALLLREMNHRIKNLFALTSGLISLSARAATSAASLAADLSGRISSLARAHDLTLPDLSREVMSDVATTTTALLKAILEPHDDVSSSRIVIVGCDVPVGPRALTSLALLLHEFTTNAAKYGALSTPFGRLRINVAAEGGILEVVWIERGGPKLGPDPAAEGFGSTLERASIRGLDGEINRSWAEDGLTINMTIPLQSLAR
jgi:PAS domain S-box-containing protein